jgi:hypothetical protein
VNIGANVTLTPSLTSNQTINDIKSTSYSINPNSGASINGNTLTQSGLGTVSIYYDGQLYRAYSVNFAERTSMVVADNSENFGG